MPVPPPPQFLHTGPRRRVAGRSATDPQRGGAGQRLRPPLAGREAPGGGRGGAGPADHCRGGRPRRRLGPPPGAATAGQGVPPPPPMGLVCRPAIWAFGWSICDTIFAKNRPLRTGCRPNQLPTPVQVSSRSRRFFEGLGKSAKVQGCQKVLFFLPKPTIICKYYHFFGRFLLVFFIGLLALIQCGGLEIVFF